MNDQPSTPLWRRLGRRLAPWASVWLMAVLGCSAGADDLSRPRRSASPAGAADSPTGADRPGASGPAVWQILDLLEPCDLSGDIGDGGRPDHADQPSTPPDHRLPAGDPVEKAQHPPADPASDAPDTPPPADPDRRPSPKPVRGSGASEPPDFLNSSTHKWAARSTGFLHSPAPVFIIRIAVITS